VTASGRRAHVLIVDDDPGVLNATRMLLKVEGFRVSTADSLEEAIRISAEQSDIELLITDYHLSDGKIGTDVIDAVRCAIGANLKAVLITGDTSHALKEAIQDDRVRLASKPINADEFLAVRIARELIPAGIGTSGSYVAPQPESKVGTFSHVLVTEAKKRGWVLISMKDDWK
jgi:DNA-binding NtrC family response regulator